jgi:hypothetical protein
MSRLGRSARLLGTAALAAAVWSFPAPQAHAAPLVNFAIVGRIYGSSDAFSSVIGPIPQFGAIEYQVIVDVAPTGTINIQGSTTRTITSLIVGTDGLGTNKMDIFESAAQAVQLSFDYPASLNPDPSPLANDDWGAPPAGRGGTPTPRPGQPAYNDLIDIFAVHAGGVHTAVDPEIMMTGVCSVDSSNGFTGLMQMRFSTVTPSGNVKINGGTVVFITTTTENSADPITAYAPLTIVPEPASALLAGIATLGLLARRTDKCHV